MTIDAASSASAFARPLAVPPLPETEFADCEVTTNFPLAVDAARLHALHVRLDLFAAATGRRERPGRSPRRRSRFEKSFCIKVR